MPIGCRCIAALVMAVEAAVGRVGVANVPIVIAINEDQQVGWWVAVGG